MPDNTKETKRLRQQVAILEAEISRLQQELAALRLEQMAAVNQLTGQY